MDRFASLAALALTLASPALAEELRVDPDAGNNTFSAVFDAKLGERITAQSTEDPQVSERDRQRSSSPGATRALKRRAHGEAGMTSAGP